MNEENGTNYYEIMAKRQHDHIYNKTTWIDDCVAMNIWVDYQFSKGMPFDDALSAGVDWYMNIIIVPEDEVYITGEFEPHHKSWGKRSNRWKVYPRSDKVEWQCEHGIGHGDEPHGCDGCCRSSSYPGKKAHVVITD